MFDLSYIVKGTPRMSDIAFLWKMPIKPHIPVREAIRKAIIDQETNPKIVAEHAGLSRQFVYDYLVGNKDEIKAHNLAKVLRVLGLPLDMIDAKKRVRGTGSTSERLMIAGTISGDAFRNRPEPEPSDIPPVDGHSPNTQSAIIVTTSNFQDIPPGQSIAARGDFLIISNNESLIIEGAYVVVEQRKKNLVLLTLTQAHIAGDRVELTPITKRITDRLKPITFPVGYPKGFVGVVLRVVKG